MRLQPFLQLLSLYLIAESSVLVGAQVRSPYLEVAHRDPHIQGKQAPFQGPIIDSQVDSKISSILTAWGVSGGVGIAIIRKDAEGNWIEERKGYGNATFEGAPITENTRFMIGSNSKLFTAVAAGLLTHEQSASPQLQWRSKIASVIPEWNLMDPVASNGSTIVDLISHRTGLPRHDLMYSIDDTAKTILPRMKYLRPSAEFRDIWQYNNIMYTILSELPARVLPDKPSLSKYVTRKVFQPLGMNHSTYSYNSAKASGQLATAFGRYNVDIANSSTDAGTPRGLPPFPRPWDENTGVFVGPGGVFMSLVDASTWLKTLLLEGRHPVTSEQIIPVDVLSTVHSGISVRGTPLIAPLMPQYFSPSVYGGGQISYTYRGFNIIEHGGAVMGHYTQICRLPYDGLGFAVFTNDEMYGPLIHEIIKFYLIERALGLEPVEWSENVLHIVPSVYYPGPLATPRPSPAAPPLVPFPSAAGIYNNAGYGRIEFCYIPPHSNVTTEASTTCHALVARVPVILPGKIDPSIPTFVASWDKAAGSHVLATHFNGSIFNVTAVFSIASNDTAKPYFVHPDLEQDIKPGVLEFARVGSKLGFSLNGIWGVEPPVQSGNVRDRAEVWFDRV